MSPLFLSFEKENKRLSCIYKLNANITPASLSNLLQNHNKLLITSGRGIEVKKFLSVNKENYVDTLNTMQNENLDRNLVSSLNAFFTGCTEKDFFMNI